ncbi:MAG: rRNA pseudouridine synthase, partial [Bacteroidales bacterium]|nr:rRNA pseudouridine synthase [Bacteroidales bacterium]
GKNSFHTKTDPKEQKHYRRNNDRDVSPYKKNFRRDDNDRDTSPYKKNFRRDDNDRDTSPYKKNFRRDDNTKENGDNPQRKRVSTVLDSEIMREIVQKRRATGRQSHKQKVLSLSWSEDRGPIRLNKYIANSGICSRREADSLIIAGAITVNGQVVTELGTKVMPVDEVRYGDKVLQREKPVYILLNKPKGFITTTDDERGRDNVMMLIEGACPQRVYPVGRLDRDTTGLLLFTNDGEMTKKLTHPRHDIKKIYQVELDKDILLSDFETLANGIELSDGFMKPDDLAFVDGQKNVLGIVLHSGRNRIVRRLFSHLGYEIEKLDRVYYAGLTKKDLPRGQWRFLRQEEINILKRSL